MKTKLATITRNKKGEPVSTEQTVVAETLRIGRGGDCKLHLAEIGRASCRERVYSSV